MKTEQLKRGTEISNELARLTEHKKALSLTPGANQRKMYFFIGGRNEPADNYKEQTFNNPEILEMARVLLLANLDKQIKDLYEEFEKL